MQILPWMGPGLYGFALFALFTYLCFMGIYCYLLCVLADPGSVPRDYQHDPEDATSTYIQARYSA